MIDKPDYDPEEDDNDAFGEREPAQTGFLDHVEDLRRTVLKSALALVLASCMAIFFFSRLASALKWPLDRALADQPERLAALTTTDPFGVFSVLIQVCLLGGVAIALPFIFYFVIHFVAPALTEAEKRILKPCCLAIFGLFLLGMLFSYFLILPATLEASLYFNQLLGLDTIWTAKSYYGMVVWMCLGVGLAFEFPLVLVLLQHLGVVETRIFREGRRYAVVIVMIVAALITPGGDPVSLALLCLPMYGMYEVAILVGGWMEKRKARQRALDEQASEL